MTLQELANHPVLKNGTKVTVTVKVGDETFTGKVVGRGAECPNPIYLVECTDQFLPNETYPYKTCIICLSEMTVVSNAN